MTINSFNLKSLPESYVSFLESCPWQAASFLAQMLREKSFEHYLGENPLLFILSENGEPAAFCTLSQKDAIDDERLYPWIGFVYTAEEFRGKRLSEAVIRAALETASEKGFEKVYLTTDHIGFYEKYGFVYLENRKDVFGCDSRIYVYNIK